MVLVDTSVWVAHFKFPNDNLIDLLNRDDVYCHPLIIAELACGTPPEPRKRTLNDFSLLRTSTIATIEEVLNIIEQKQLYGRGCGFIDIALLTSTLLSADTQLWTLDKRLSKLAAELNINYQIEN